MKHLDHFQPFPELLRAVSVWKVVDVRIMKLFFSSTDALEVQAGLEMLAQAAIRYELRYNPALRAEAQLWVQEDNDFPAALSLLSTCRSAAR